MENKDLERTEELLSKGGSKKKKKSIVIIAVVAMLVIACVGGLAGVNAHKSKVQAKSLEMAEKYMSEGEYEQAVEAYTAAIDIDAKSAPAFEGRADAYVKLNKPKQAAEDYIEVIKLDPKNKDAYKKGLEAAVSSGDEKLTDEIKGLIKDNDVGIDTDAALYGGLMQDYLDAMRAGDESKAKEIAKEMPQDDYYTESCVSEMTDEQKAAFLDKLKTFSKDDLFGYYLSDFDDDGACDLIINSRDHDSLNGRSTIFEVFSYDGGSLKSISKWYAFMYRLYAYPGHEGIVTSISESMPPQWGIYVMAKGENEYEEVLFKDMAAYVETWDQHVVEPGLELDPHNGLKKNESSMSSDVDLSVLE